MIYKLSIIAILRFLLLLIFACSQAAFAMTANPASEGVQHPDLTESISSSFNGSDNDSVNEGPAFNGAGLQIDLPELDAGRHFQPDPRKAALYSAVLPGLGQIYNRRYWKVPIVYGGFTALSWYAMFTHEEFVRYRNAHSFRIDGNPETIDEFAGDARYTEDVLKRFTDYYRRQRDRTFIWMALFYGLNIIDATVDAHFFEFDVSDELGIRVGPSVTAPDRPVIGRAGSQAGPGIRFSLNF